MQTMKIVILLGDVRFGPIDDSTLATIESIDDLERLEGLCEKLLHATSWADLMTEFSKHIYVDAEKRGQIKEIKKLLTREHIATLSKYFEVDPAAFMGPV